jgi:hypothetical protein
MTKSNVIPLPPRELSSRPREVYKEEKIKRHNNISRLSEDIGCVEVSDETCPLTQRTSSSESVALASPLTSSSLGRDHSVALEDNVIAARTASRVTGITAQHARTAKGVKVMLNLQTAVNRDTGVFVPVTAELKRYDRLREISSRDTDSEQFDRLLTDLLDRISTSGDRSYCVGRIHERGRRAAWIQDSVVIGTLSADVITNIAVFIHNERYDISMDQPLSERQLRHYHSQGRWGEIVTGQSAPTLDTVRTRTWR